ncbi:hypothetical protein PENTCL1PPCAC_10685 [Pristionchus entomophagus]|uniref:Uncharacterized protein n=1 Tax=Pristionchus entomophagus TaxID=358040 RepID=A0AAV5T0E1_9BILA|nr:hypothetical protein PENTCL1PPCAC_10685 [Pristionchus entomophagus]
MVHRGFKRESDTNQQKTMAPFNTEKREVFDTPDMNTEVSRRMGELLLRGHTMLNAECECGGILMEDRNGVRRCISCEVREEAPADPPVASEESSASSINTEVVVDQGEMREYVSNGMGRLLMKGYTMLDAYCSCSCILMEDREGNRTCLACEFRERKRNKKDTVEADMGFKVVEIPLNAEIPSSSRSVQIDWDDDLEEDKKDTERDAITAKMGEYLLKGVAMLDEYCNCGGIMMQERGGGRKLCVECEIRNEGKEKMEEEKKKIEPVKEVKKTEEKPPKKVSFHDQHSHIRKALPPSEWKTVTQMTIESKLIWLSNRLSKTEDYEEMSKILDLIAKATSVVKHL